MVAATPQSAGVTPSSVPALHMAASLGDSAEVRRLLAPVSYSALSLDNRIRAISAAASGLHAGGFGAQWQVLKTSDHMRIEWLPHGIKVPCRVVCVYPETMRCDVYVKSSLMPEQEITVDNDAHLVDVLKFVSTAKMCTGYHDERRATCFGTSCPRLLPARCATHASETRSNRCCARAAVDQRQDPATPPSDNQAGVVAPSGAPRCKTCTTSDERVRKAATRRTQASASADAKQHELHEGKNAQILRLRQEAEVKQKEFDQVKVTLLESERGLADLRLEVNTMAENKEFMQLVRAEQSEAARAFLDDQDESRMRGRDSKKKEKGMRWSSACAPTCALAHPAAAYLSIIIDIS
jgi:hypothetical protein